MKFDTAIIILNWNGKIYTKNCLDSIRKNTFYENYKIIVVDNGSTDGSQKMIKSQYKEVYLIENQSNKGFAGGNNDAIKFATKKYNSKYFYLLNNDTLVQKNWLSESIKTSKTMDAGIVGSRQLTFDKEPAISAGWIKSFGVHYYFGNKEKEVDWVSGAGFLVKKEVFDKIGLLDEIYNPAYYEETDLERRAIKAGFKIFHSPKSIFLHKGGVTSKKEISNLSELFYRNRFIYFFKYYGLLYFLPRAFFDIFREFKKEKFKGIKNLFNNYKKGYILIKKNK